VRTHCGGVNIFHRSVKMIVIHLVLISANVHNIS